MSERPPASRRRVFFALWPEALERAQLERSLAGRLAAAVGRVLDPLDWHVTLRFLGAVEAPVLTALRAGARALKGSGFELRFGHVEYWAPSRVLALAAAAPPPELLELARALEGLARSSGLAAEERPLRPHITLARGVPPSLEGGLELTLRVSEFHLAESMARPVEGESARRYRRLDSWPLRG